MKTKTFLLTASGVLALDQFTKALVQRNLPLGGGISLLPFFNLTHVQNTGAAFGMFPSANTGFVLATGLILVFLAVYHRRLALQGPWSRWGLTLVWGGALGNLTDRLRLGAVTDFLHFYWRRWSWPDFNVADSAICIGVCLMFVESFRKDAPHPS